MDVGRTVLLVEDSPFQYSTLKRAFEVAGWAVIRAEDEGSTLFVLNQVQDTGQSIDVVALDLGLPPEKDNPLRVGVLLARILRQRDTSLPILTYTSVPPTAVNYDLLVAALLPLRVSFIYLRPLGDDVELADLLKLTWQGFVILSPEPADFLPQAVSSRPDPLNDQLWQTLSLLSEGLSHKQIAQQLPSIGTDGVKARLSKIRETLLASGELESHETDKDGLITWYRRHRARYCRA